MMNKLALEIMSVYLRKMLTGSLCLALVLGLFGCGGEEGGSGSGSQSVGQTISLSWDAPSTNSNGSTLSDLLGYKVYYGNSSGDYTKMLVVENASFCEISFLSPGTWYFSVTAYDSQGNESDFSNEAVLVISDNIT